MLELPVPQTKEESIDHAKQYAAHLLAMPRIRTMARLRLRIRIEEHPAWFHAWLNDEIARIKYQIEVLNAWNKICNPEALAKRIRSSIVQVDYMMRVFLGLASVAPVDLDSHLEWLHLLADE